MSETTAPSIKTLRRKKLELQEELQRLQSTRSDTDREMSRVAGQIRDLDEKIQIKASQPSVSEHAVLRYLERVHGVNVDEVRAEILSGRNLKIVEQLGSCELPLGNGHKAIVKNKTVVTIE